ncbi:tetratricopeptide repeat protein [Candidatus Sumerlaeota bacterium]|nr:tetratricopeptide repeat protein [Candidatus Sumerlaeota bacterium]
MAMKTAILRTAVATLAALSLLCFSTGCYSTLFGSGSLERDMARTATGIDRIAQMNRDTQKIVETQLKTLETRQQADSALFTSNLASLGEQIRALQETLDQTRQEMQQIRFRMTGEAPDRIPIVVGRGDVASTVILEGQQLLLQGEQALQRKDYLAARSSFQEYVKRFPTSPRAAEAHMRIGESYIREGKLLEAVAALQVVEQLYVNSPLVPEALMKIASCQEQMGQVQQAVATLKRLVSQHQKWEKIEAAQETLRKLDRVESQVPPTAPR